MNFWVKIKSPIVFATFTIDDEHRKNMSVSPNYLRNFKTAVIRAIESTGCEDYIINIDYGLENEREHFHCLLAFRTDDYFTKSSHKGQVEMKNLNYNLGFTTFKLCETSEKDIAKLGEYMNKLISHSLKVKQSYISTKKGSPYQKWKNGKIKVDRFIKKNWELGTGKD